MPATVTVATQTVKSSTKGLSKGDSNTAPVKSLPGDNKDDQPGRIKQLSFLLYTILHYINYSHRMQVDKHSAATLHIIIEFMDVCSECM